MYITFSSEDCQSLQPKNRSVLDERVCSLGTLGEVHQPV